MPTTIKPRMTFKSETSRLQRKGFFVQRGSCLNPSWRGKSPPAACCSLSVIAVEASPESLCSFYKRKNLSSNVFRYRTKNTNLSTGDKHSLLVQIFIGGRLTSVQSRLRSRSHDNQLLANPTRRNLTPIVTAEGTCIH